MGPCGGRLRRAEVDLARPWLAGAVVPVVIIVAVDDADKGWVPEVGGNAGECDMVGDGEEEVGGGCRLYVMVPSSLWSSYTVFGVKANFPNKGLRSAIPQVPESANKPGIFSAVSRYQGSLFVFQPLSDRFLLQVPMERLDSITRVSSQVFPPFPPSLCLCFLRIFPMIAKHPSSARPRPGPFFFLFSLLLLPRAHHSDQNYLFESQNPGKFTLQGTNTYLIGHSQPYVLLDTGEGEPAYISFLETALLQSTPDPGPPPYSHVNNLVSDIIISHRHHDHHGGLPAVLSLIHKLSKANENFDKSLGYVPPRIHKFPSPSVLSARQTFTAEAEGASFDSTLQIVSQLPTEYFQHQEHSPLPLIHVLRSGQTIQTLSSTPTLLTVLHTPGHTTDSICLSIADDSAIFTADTILGEGTAVFEDLGAYMQSLHALESAAISLRSSTGSGATGNVVLYPGHGAVVSNGEETIKTYIAHRTEREAQILALIPYLDATSSSKAEPSTPPQKEGVGVKSIVRTLYAGYPPAIWPAAERGVRLHLIKLEQDGKAQSVQSPNKGEVEAGKDHEEFWVRRVRDL